MTQINWLAKDLPSQNAVSKLAEELNINFTIATLLIQRGIHTFDEARHFFRPKLEDLHDPFLMKGMEAAIERIEKAVENGEKILVYGDYDVDGTTAVATVYSFFSQFYPNIDYYIPDRYKEGYGISYIGIDWAKENGFSLIIALDCGIKSVAHVAYAKERDIDFIICDHHLPGNVIPDAVAVLDPKQPDCPYPYKELSGCGIGFKLIQGWCVKHQLGESRLEEFLDLSAVSIASDIVEIAGENRILAFHGIQKLRNNPCHGFRSLMEQSARKQPITISDVVFTIGPRINAAGRMSDARGAVRLMLSDNPEQAKEFGEILNAFNLNRRNFDADITKTALSMIESSEEMLAGKSTVVFNKEWHKGVIGIVASRLIEKYYRPTIVLTESNGMATGSARSVNGFDLYSAIESCSDFLEQFGGHTHAAGLSLKLENLEKFRAKFEEVVASTITEKSLYPEINYDLEISFHEISPKFYRILSQMEPFGPGNMKPLFVTRNLLDTGQAKIVGEKHLKLNVRESASGMVFPAIGFGLSHYYEPVKQGKSFDLCYAVEENEYNGRVSIQLNIKDIRIHP